MKKIGLFGGTFDPIHLGHTRMARAFADEAGLDAVVFLPAGSPYHKTAAQTSAEHRLAMTALACAADPRFAVSDCDIVREGATYTFDTVQIFRQQFPQAELFWLLGMDSLLQLHTWKKWQTLVRQIKFAVAGREGGRLNDAPPPLQTWLGGALADGSVRLLDAPLCNISSSNIRSRLQVGQSTEGMLDGRVADYIREHGLYGTHN